MALPDRETPAPFPRIVALGGGTGLPVVLSGLADVLRGLVGGSNASRWADHLTAIVTVSDDGGSSGRLRSELGVLPPGDIRNCLAALAPNGTLARVLTHRFATNQQLDGHAVGNLLIAALAQMTGDFAQAIDELATLLDTCGRVFPCTIADVRLRAELSNGDVVEGETAIVGHPARIQRIELAPHAAPWPDALRALVNADIVVVGPGSLYTSVLPNLLVEGVASTLSALQSTRILVANLMTQPGETDGMSLDDHLRAIRAHTGRDLFDVILVNRTPPAGTRLARYRSGRSEAVQMEGLLSAAGSAKVIEADLLDTSGPKVRHDPAKLADAILAVAGWVPAEEPSSEVGTRADQFPPPQTKVVHGADVFRNSQRFSPENAENRAIGVAVEAVRDLLLIPASRTARPNFVVCLSAQWARKSRERHDPTPTEDQGVESIAHRLCNDAGVEHHELRRAARSVGPPRADERLQHHVDVQ